MSRLVASTFRTLVPLFTLAALMSVPTADAAVGTVDLSWTGCSVLTSDRTPTADDSNVLWVTVTGHDDPHKAYEAWIVVHDAEGGLPDAWRFDDYSNGCQGMSSVRIDHTSKSCPSFSGDLPSIQIKNFGPPPASFGLPAGAMMAVIANAYPAGVSDSNAETRYFLASFRFDHAQSVEGVSPDAEHCGGFETPVSFYLHAPRVKYVDLSGDEQFFAVGNAIATVHGGAGQSLPAATTTWGAIKGQYRR